MRLVTIFIIGLALLIVACQQKSEQPKQALSLQVFQSGPQLVKIAISDPAAADSLIQAGVEVIVQEDKWVIARINAEQAGAMQEGGKQMQSAEESDLRQRLVQIILTQPSDLQEVGDTGIDIWEVKGDTVIAQAFDIYLRRLEAMGYPVLILQNDIHDVMKKGGGNEQ